MSSSRVGERGVRGRGPAGQQLELDIEPDEGLDAPEEELLGARGELVRRPPVVGRVQPAAWEVGNTLGGGQSTGSGVKALMRKPVEEGWQH